MGWRLICPTEVEFHAARGRGVLMGVTALRGFTLLEMLVVMVLMGLITALALPAMQRWHDAIQVKAQSAVVVDALRNAAFAAGASRRTVTLDESSFRKPGHLAGTVPLAGVALPEAPAPGPSILQIDLPHGWQVDRVQPAQFLSNGLCAAGMVALRTTTGETVTIEVHGPVCGVELATAGAVG